MGEKAYNVLQVISDQHIATCMGCEGHTQAITPNMDRLAARGVRFTRAYTANPICTPSRVSVLSGQYCHNHGYYGLSGPTPGIGTAPLPNFLRHFRAHGYRTAGIGKLHLPDCPNDWVAGDVDLHADCYSYHESGMMDEKSSSSPYYQYLVKLGLREKEDSISLPEFPGLQQHEGRPSLLPYEHSVEGWCASQAMQFIDQCRTEDKPFCMQVSLPRPHQCYTPDQKFWDMYPEDLALPPTFGQDASQRPPHFRTMHDSYAQHGEGLLEPKGFDQVSRRVWRAYLACITQVDFALGQLLDYLEKNGLAENTIVIYHSDHGAYSTSFGLPEKAPGICSEFVCRVPFIWSAPGVTKPGHVTPLFTHNVDIAPTISSLCGLPPMESADGCDITGLLRGEDTPVREVAVTEHPWSKSLRWKNWRFVHYQREMFGGEDVGELYDIESDPDETKNLYGDSAHRDALDQCRRLLLEWLIGTTRPTTVWPGTEESPRFYRTAGDGKESNLTGPRARIRPTADWPAGDPWKMMYL